MMASEHIHLWRTFGWDGKAPELNRRRCIVCGVEETYTGPTSYVLVDGDKLEQLQQQLAQARSEAERYAGLAGRAEYEAELLREENAAMRALLEDASGTMEEATRNHEDADAVGALHASIRRIDAFLAEHPQ